MQKKPYKKRPYSTGNPELDKKIHALVEKAKVSANTDLLEEIILTAFKLYDSDMNRGDIKLLNTALKELRYAFKVFYPYRHVRKVTIFGSARTPKSNPDYKQAKEFSRQIASAGWMVITGAASGIMNAGNEGAGRANSFGVNIRLPFEQEANPVMLDDPKLVNFKYFFTRKLIFIRESDATLLCPGGFGTHDEGFETITLVQTGKTNPRPIVCLDPPSSKYWEAFRDWINRHLGQRGMIDPEDIRLMDFTHDPEEAVRLVTHFYRNYHSCRYIQNRLVLRLKKPLTGKQLLRVNKEFSDIVVKGKMMQQDKPFEEEYDETPDTQDLARLSFHFDRRHYVRLKRLIETINET